MVSYKAHFLVSIGITCFEEVKPVHGSIAWPHSQDICPDTLYEKSKLNERLGLDGLPSVDLGGYLHKPRRRIIEEALIALAEIAFHPSVLRLLSSVLCLLSSVFNTAAATNGEVSAEQAFVAKILFGAGKGQLFTAGGKFLYRRFKNIA